MRQNRHHDSPGQGLAEAGGTNRSAAVCDGGVMDDLFARIWENFGGRIGGPFSFRLLLQPVVASVLGIRAGLEDARAGRPPYFWSILTKPGERRDLLHQGLKGVANVFVFA